MSKFVFPKTARNLSPLSLLVLTACGGGGGYQPFSGNVVKGPLSDALVGFDYDGDGVVDSSRVRTDADGGFTLTPTQSSYTVIAVTDDSTIDASSGAVLSGITLKAPSGATVVTPTTTLMNEGGLTAAQVSDVLGLPAGVDPLTFNAFAAGVNAADALAVEKVSHQIMSVVNAFASAAEGAGATEEVAFTAALNSLVEVVKTKAASSGSLDLTDNADLALIKDQAKTDMATIAGVNTTAFNALADDTATAVENVNAKIEGITDTNLDSDASKNIFSTTQVLADQVKTAVAAEVSSAGSGSSSITFTDANVVNTAANNKAPTDIALSTNSISETAGALVIGTLTTTDSDQTANVKFTYALAEITGSDHAAFSINQATGELSLKAQPDFETKSSYSVTILSTDEGGKTFSKSFTISVGDVNEAPTVANAIADQTIAEDSALSFQFASDVFEDVDAGDSFTYTATLADGSDLPDWLSFDEVTRTFSGTPSNADVGVIGVKVTATDSGSVAVSDTFDLTVTNTSDAAISFEVDLNATDGLGQIIDQDLTTFGSKLSNFYNDSDSGINNILDRLNSEEFGQTDDQIKISSNGISISNADGYILSLEFSNFSPASLEELEELAYNFDGTIEKFEISGGFKAIALSDPDGNKMIELSHSAEGIAWRNLRADDDEISTFMIEGDFENQIANYKNVLTELSELDTAETEPNTQDELDAIASLVEITGISARDASGDIFSVRLRSNDDNEDSAEISLKGAENTHIFALGATGVTAFISGLLELDSDGSAFELFTASDELYAGYSIRYENGDSFYQHNTADGSWQYYDIDGKQANPSYDPIGVKEPKWLDLSALPDTDVNDVVTYYIGTNYYYADLVNNETTQDKYNARIAEMQAVFNYTEGNKDAQELFGLNLSYEYGGVDVFSTNINSIDWVKFNQTDNIENNLDLSQGLQFFDFDDGSDREITLIIDKSDIVDLKLLGVNKDDFEETYIASNNDLVLAIGEYTDFLDFFSDDYIEQDIA